MDKVLVYQKLSEIKSRGIDVTDATVKLAMSESVPDSVIKFIESNTMTESKKFFENLRELHNKKNHKLYSNILDESLDEVGKLKCLSSYMTSACIAMESMDNPDKCLELRKSIGLEVVSEALADYYNGRDYDKINEALSYLRTLIKK